MKQKDYAGKGFMIATDLSRENVGRGQKKPRQTPELQQADYEITATGTQPGGDRFSLAIS
jgi:hypothetical protein